MQYLRVLDFLFVSQQNMHPASLLSASMFHATHLVQNIFAIHTLKQCRSTTGIVVLIRADERLLWVRVLLVPMQGYAILDIRRNQATTTWYYAPELTKAGQ